jgi:hypothetical protein
MRVSLHRLSAAEAMASSLKLTLEAQYIGGYSVECALKALLLEITPEADRPPMLAMITRGANHHRPEVLLAYLRDRGRTLNTELARRMRRFRWTTDLRYEVGRRDTGETTWFLRTARAVQQWVEEQLS